MRTWIWAHLDDFTHDEFAMLIVQHAGGCHEICVGGFIRRCAPPSESSPNWLEVK